VYGTSEGRRTGGFRVHLDALENKVMATEHREIETTYDVDEAAALPALDGLPDVDHVDGPRSVRLEARYFDTEDQALGRRGITLRRRTGGDDEGWHLKLPVTGARQEIQAPLGRTVHTPPLALRRVVQGVLRDQVLGQVATITTERTTASLLGASKSLLAEVCDDRVTATRAGPDGTEDHAWREWEVEVHGARPRLTKALDKRMRKAGAEEASGRSKFGRLMQLDAGAPPDERLDIDEGATERELLAWHLTLLVGDLHRVDPMARADIPDAVHQLRIAIRRMRSALTSFDACFDSALTDAIRDELRWIGDILGSPRDLEVLQSRLGGLLSTLSPGLVRARPGSWINANLRAARRSAHKDVLEAMASDRYFSLVDSLDSWLVDPPWSDRKDRRASKALPKLLGHEWARVEKAVQKADAAGEIERPELLHQVRKRAKKARYVAEALQPVLGPDARDSAKAAKKVQRSLGAHHDTLLAIEYVLDLAATAHDDGRDTFTFGVLLARLESELAEHDRAFRRTWKKLRPRE
jgi:CHAD domain-containing protein